MKKNSFSLSCRVAAVLGIAVCGSAFAQANYFEQTAGPMIGGKYIRTYRLAINRQDQIFAATDSGVFRSEDNGDHWTRLINGVAAPYRVVPIAINSKGHIFISNMYDMYRSTDNGDSWVKITNNMTEPAFDIAINSVDTVFAGKFRSGDNGNMWRKIINIYCNPYDPGPANGFPTWHIATGSENEVLVSNDFELYRSSDNGETFQKILSIGAMRIGPIILTKNDNILALVADSAQYICYGPPVYCYYDGSNIKDYIYNSQDHGKSWIDIFNTPDPNREGLGGYREPLKESPTGNIFFIKFNVILPYSINQFISTLFINWQPQSNYIIPTSLRFFDLSFTSDGNVFAATGFKTSSLSDSGGVYRHSLSSQIFYTQTENKNNSFYLKLKKSTSLNREIVISLPICVPVSLSIHNAQGKTLKTFLLSTILQPGQHTFSFQSQDLPAGVYLIRLKTSNEYINKIFTLLK